MSLVILLVILLAGSIITFAVGDKYASKVALTFSIIAAAFSIILLLDYDSAPIEYSIQWVQNPNLNLSFKLDGLSLLMILLNSLLLPIIILCSISYKVPFEKLLYSLVLFMSFAMAGVFLSSDALVYYVFWEASLIPIYFIIVMWGNGDKSKRRSAALTFFVYTFAGSLFMMASIIYLYSKTGSFQIDAFYNASLSNTEQIWVFLGFFLAYAIKIPIFPFHSWQANVYQRAPLIGTLLLGALMSKMGLYSVIRWQLPIAPYALELFQNIILTLSIIGVIYGSIIALRQTNLKRFFAYASLAHVGFITGGIYALNYEGLLGAVILILAHGFGIVGLFFSSEIIFRRMGTIQINELGGIKSKAPWFTLAFMLMILASITIPMSFNFVGEFTIMFGVYKVSIWPLLLLGTSMFLGAYIMFKMYQTVMLGESKDNVSFRDLTWNEGFIFAILTFVLVFFGLYSKPIVTIVTPALQEILVYINK